MDKLQALAFVGGLLAFYAFQQLLSQWVKSRNGNSYQEFKKEIKATVNELSNSIMNLEQKFARLDEKINYLTLLIKELRGKE